MQKLTVLRRWEAGNSELNFKIYVDSKDLGNIGAGESLFADIVSEKVTIKIVHYSKTTDLKISKTMILNNMKNPRISFGVFSSQVLQYLKIVTDVSGATILQEF